MLKDLIIKSGETQTIWAERLGIGKPYLSDILNGKRKPSLDLAGRIFRVTNGAVAMESWICPDRDPENEDAA